MTVRIATGSIGHETNTFSKVMTTLENFEQGSYVTDAKLLLAFANTATVSGGFINRARELDILLVPLLWTFATPSATIKQSAYETLKSRFLERLEAALPLDGVLLDLHGAMVTEAHEDAEGDLLTNVRKVVGSLPVITTLDLHANITPQMAEQTDCIIGFDTYPHVDCYDRGLEAMQLMHDTVTGDVSPTMAYRQLPLLTGPPAQCTMKPPMSDIVTELHALEAQPGVLTATLSMGFPFADICDAGASVLVTTDGNPRLAEKCAQEFASYLWNRRNDLVTNLVSVEEAIARSGETHGRPFVLAEGSDNPGGGGPCDGTHVLRTFIDADVQEAIIAVIADRESVAQAFAAGVGAHVDLLIGGKTDPLHGEPVAANAYVKRLSDGQFVYKGPMGRGKLGSLGRTAVVEVRGVTIILTELRTQPYDAEVLRSVGIQPEDAKLIVLKSAVHYRADYTPIAHEILDVDTPGVHSPDLFSYEYHKLRRPIFPLDGEVIWE